MYSSSLVHSDLISRIRASQASRLIAAHPQDASLTASILSHERRYLFSGAPISWVGTSSRSAGRAVAQTSISDAALDKVRSEYLETVQASQIDYPHWAGDYSIGENAVYFWQALVSIRKVQGRSASSLTRSVVVLAVLAGVFVRINPLSQTHKQRLQQISAIRTNFGLNKGLVLVICVLSSWVGFIGVSTYRTLRDWVRKTRESSDSSGSTLFKQYGEETLEINSINHEAQRVLRSSSKLWRHVL